MVAWRARSRDTAAMPSHVLPPSSSFTHAGRTIAYRAYGEGALTVVLTHGLLMDGRMYTALAPTLAARGFRVITVDMLGHGESARVTDMTAHSMPAYGADVIALLDHLGVAQAVVGGTSLGANVALEAAAAAPDRVRALFLEMPVLENGLAGAAALFVPLALALRISQRSMQTVAAIARRIPRTHFLVDIVLDFARRDPATSLAILDGLTFGRTAPPADQRRALPHPALVVGHPGIQRLARFGRGGGADGGPAPFPARSGAGTAGPASVRGARVHDQGLPVRRALLCALGCARVRGR